MADFMAALYVAITAVEDGKVAEIELEDRTVHPDETETILTVTVRKEVLVRQET